MKQWTHIHPVFRNRIFFLLSLLVACLQPAVARQSRVLDVTSTKGTRVEALPGKLLTLSFRVTNTSTTRQRFESVISVPPGWRKLAGESQFDVESGASDIRLANISVPAEAPAGEYQLRYGIRDQTSPTPIEEVSVTVVVVAIRTVILRLMDSPRLVLAGEAYVSLFLLENNGNVPSIVDLKIRSSNGFPGVADSSLVHLKPGESRSIKVTVRTDVKLLARVKDILEVTAETDRSVAASASSGVDVVPRVTGVEDLFVEFPIQATARLAGQQGKNGPQLEIVGVGPLDQTRTDRLDLLIRTPDIQKQSILGQRDEYHLSYTTKTYGVYLGDKSFSLSPLTEYNRYAFGASAIASLQEFSVGAFVNEMRMGDPGQKEWAGFVGYKANERASFSINYLGKRDQGSGSVLSVRSIVKPLSGNEFDLEYGLGTFEGRSDRAYSARWNVFENWISSEIQYLHAGPGYPGYYRDVDFKNVTLNLSPIKNIKIEGYYHDEERNLDRDSTLLIAPGNRYLLVGAGFSDLIAVYYMMNAQRDLLPKPKLQKEERSWQVRASQTLAGVTLVANADFGTSEDQLTGMSSPLRRYSLFVNLNPLPGLSLGLSSEYSKDVDPTTLEEQSLLSGGVRSTVSFGVDTRFAASLYATRTQGPFSQTYSLFDVSFEHRFSFGHSVAIRGRQTILALAGTGKEIAYLAEYSVPIGIPIARRTEYGRLIGKVVNAETGKGIPNLLVYTGGATAVTDRDGQYYFPALKPEKQYVQVDMGNINLNLVALQQLPQELDIVGGKETRFDIALTRSAMVTGVVLLYTFREQSPGDTSQPALIEQGGHSNVILELSNPQELNRRVSDSKGRFSFTGIRPGKWTLRILEGNLPQNTYFEKDSYNIDAAPGASMEFTFKALPRKRRIQILQQGKTLEAPPQKEKAPEAVPPKTKRNEPAPKAKAIKRTPKKDTPSSDAPR